MDISEQVASFKQAKKLVELGVRLQTRLVWIEMMGTWELSPNLSDDQEKGIITYPAPTVAELGVLLPIWYDTEYKSPIVDFWRDPQGGFNGRIEFATSTTDKPLIYASTEAQARAGALIWLIENGYIKVDGLKL